MAEQTKPKTEEKDHPQDGKKYLQRTISQQPHVSSLHGSIHIQIHTHIYINTQQKMGQ